MTWESLFLPAVLAAAGVIIGGVITWWFYARAAKDLQREASELRRLIVIMLLGMEKQGWIELTRGPHGEILGFRQKVGPPGIPTEERFGTPRIIQGGLPELPSMS